METPPAPPVMRFLNYTADPQGGLTRIREITSRWVRNAARLAAAHAVLCTGILAAVLLHDLFNGTFPDALGGAVNNWISSYGWPMFAAGVTANAAIVLLAAPRPVSRGNRWWCEAAALAMTVEQLALLVLATLLGMLAMSYFFGDAAEDHLASSWRLLAFIPAATAVWLIGVLSDISTCLQWIARNPQVEGALPSLRPRVFISSPPPPRPPNTPAS